MTCTVLMVAEKPMIAKVLANVLSEGAPVEQHHGVVPVFEYEGVFRGERALFRVTSVIGHIFKRDFPPEFQSWDKVDPMTLFDAPTVKVEENEKSHISKHLRQVSRGCDAVVLWLDCDREGENICFEVLDVVLPQLARGTRGVHRARFSALTPAELQRALRTLTVPNRHEALAVDARQVLDLKVGVAFTRFQSRFFLDKYGSLDARLLSYGPCQTPTLGFAVERHDLIQHFAPEPCFTLQAVASVGGVPLPLQWARGHVFDGETAHTLLKLAQADRHFTVEKVRTKSVHRPPPPPFHTVELLRAASQALGLGPAHAMAVAERLYLAGLISYPRTESTRFPDAFDFREVLAELARHREWGPYAAGLLRQGFVVPRGGVDHGDHPPITPMRCAREDELGGDEARLYELVCRQFLAAVSPDCVYAQTKATLRLGGEAFHCEARKVLSAGWTAVVPAKAVSEEGLPALAEGGRVEVASVRLVEGKTSPPAYLTEADLISLMEKHGIGTDASIPVHINNICERNYAQVKSGSREVVPTNLGVVLVHGYHRIDPELVLPTVRASIEHSITLIATGQASYEAVVAHALDMFKRKFAYFVASIARMDELFESSFSKLADTGRPLSKCGKCRRYMNYLPLRPPRLHCAHCDDTYSLPHNGTIKQYKGLVCPLDGFELVLYTLGSDAKAFPLCPMCYNAPPFDGFKAGMGCNTCIHPTCPFAVTRLGVAPCEECDTGLLVLDRSAPPRFKLCCNVCNAIVMLPPAKNVDVSTEKCADCNAPKLQIEFNLSTKPSVIAEASYCACVVCDERLNELCELKHSRQRHVMFQRGRRGRGRRGGHGRGKRVDPRMTFHGF